MKISLYVVKNRKKEILIIIGIILMINSLLVVVSLVKYPDWNELRRVDVITNGGNINDANISEIVWNDLLSDYRSDKYTMVYVGRYNCPACQEFKPILGEVAFDKNIFVNYYNTTLDRQKNDFDQKLKMLNLESVPALAIIGNNKVVYAEEEVFSDRKILNEYLDNYQHKYE